MSNKIMTTTKTTIAPCLQHSQQFLLLLQVLLFILVHSFSQQQHQSHGSIETENIPTPVHTLLLCRHGDSIYNGGEPGRKETFTGWMDVPLSQKGIQEAKSTGQQVSTFYSLGIDVCFTSTLQRAQMTAHYCLWAFSEKPYGLGPRRYVTDYRLNERHYGALQGFVKADVEAGKYGHDPSIVKKWRRSWDTVPPLLDDDDPRRIQELRRFSSLCGGSHNVPRGESLEQVANNRIKPFLKEKLIPILNEASTRQQHDNINATGLVVAHANSLRALIGIICEVQNSPVALKTLEALRLPTGVPLILKFKQRIDGSFQVCDLDGIPYDLYVGSDNLPPDLPIWPLASLPMQRLNEAICTMESDEQQLDGTLRSTQKDRPRLTVDSGWKRRV
jgi:2,3-bisphosphoglycerate-dependent phosphoglycerate mutase